MLNFEPDAGDPHSIPEIEITEDDLERARAAETLETLEITAADLARYDTVKQGLLVLSLEELVTFEPEVLDINLADLPPLPEIIEITLADIHGDLTNQVIDCFHGTSLEAARRIRDEGFRVGSGAALGSGIYFAVGGMSIARSYTKTSRPCIVHARVSWGKVGYLDDKKLPAAFRGSGDSPTKAALKAGYHSFITTPKYSRQSPAIGIVLETRGNYVKPPRIEIVELLDRQGKRIR
jgi:hypothetical protein